MRSGPGIESGGAGPSKQSPPCPASGQGLTQHRSDRTMDPRDLLTRAHAEVPGQQGYRIGGEFSEVTFSVETSEFQNFDSLQRAVLSVDIAGLLLSNVLTQTEHLRPNVIKKRTTLPPAASLFFRNMLS